MTLRAWRIVKRKHAATAFDGEAARITGGRWNSPGAAVVYTASSLPLAALEVLVHLPRESILSLFASISVEFNGALVTKLKSGLPSDWRTYPAPLSTMTIGDEWLRTQTSAVLQVPSVIVSRESNFLLNPAHPDFSKVSIGKPEDFRFDPRLVK